MDLMTEMRRAGLQFNHVVGTYSFHGPHPREARPMIQTIAVPTEEALSAFHVWAAETGATVREASVGTLQDVVRTYHARRGTAI